MNEDVFKFLLDVFALPFSHALQHNRTSLDHIPTISMAHDTSFSMHPTQLTVLYH